MCRAPTRSSSASTGRGGLQRPDPELLGRDPTPVEGDKLVCLRNDRAKRLLNGGLWTVLELRSRKSRAGRLDLVPEDEAGRPVEV